MATFETEAPESVNISAPRQDDSISKIRDWLPWSIVNLFLGWGFAGVLPLMLSLLCRGHKKNGNEDWARKMSRWTLILNIIITVSGIAGWICFVLLLVLVRR